MPEVKKQKTNKEAKNSVVKEIPSAIKEQKLQETVTNSKHLEKNNTSHEKQKDLWKAFFQSKKEKKNKQ